MTTTGELYAIIEELELIDIGDAASYLGEEADTEHEALVSEETSLSFASTLDPLLASERSFCQVG
jgi:hypothetical protein